MPPSRETLAEQLIGLRDIMDERDLRYSQRFAAQESASSYAQAMSNEFRESLNDVGKQQMPRTEAEALCKANADKIDALAGRMDRTEGRSGGLNAGWGYLVGLVGLAAAVIAMFFTFRK